MFTTRTVSKYYQEWVKVIKERTGERITRIRGLAQLMLGIAQARSVHLGLVSSEIGGEAKRTSREQRLWRWLSNEEVAAMPWYEAMIQPWLLSLASSAKEIALVIDASKVGFNHKLVMVGICYRKRVIPLCWQWVQHQKGDSTVKQQLEVLLWVKMMLPINSKVSVVGDTEFGNTQIIKRLRQWGWDYDLRQNPADCVEYQGEWQRLGSLVKKGQSRDLGMVKLTKKHQLKAHVIVHWDAKEDSPWIIVTSRPTLKACLRAYKKRMWIEETFGDLKGHGFDLEATQLRTADKLDRLTLAVCLLYLWLVAFGSKVIKAGLRKLVDRTHRRDLSIFRIGFDFFKEQKHKHQYSTLFLHPV